MSRNSLKSKAFERRPIIVLALGGNALSPPDHNVGGYDVEREIIKATGEALQALVVAGFRLVIVHGNGPQVGRLLESDTAIDNLDIHIAQTQGELGYLLASASNVPMVCMLTRTVVESSVGPAVKPIGPVVGSAIANAVRTSGGWRLAVPSPMPLRVIEADVIAGLLKTHHVIAGGGGGVPVSECGSPVFGVVDKDRVASLLAIELEAEHLIFATDVDYVYRRFGEDRAHSITCMTPSQGRGMVESGEVGAGSMGPKVESAAEFVEATGRPAHICGLSSIEAALANSAGTTIAAGTPG